MSGAKAAMRRVFALGQRRAMSEDQVAAIAGLAAGVRELTEAVVLTDVDPAEVAEVREQVEALTVRLSAARREAPPLAELGGDGVVQMLASPVTGTLNPIAPPLDIVARPDGTARSEFTLSAVYEGPPGFVHGGVSAMVLDHILGSAAMAHGAPGMTAGLSMRYRNPTPYGVPLVAEAEVVGVEGRKTFVEGRIIAPDGTTTVEATAVFVLPRH